MWQLPTTVKRSGQLSGIGKRQSAFLCGSPLTVSPSLRGHSGICSGTLVCRAGQASAAARLLLPLLDPGPVGRVRRAPSFEIRHHPLQGLEIVSNEAERLVAWPADESTDTLAARHAARGTAGVVVVYVQPPAFLGGAAQVAGVALPVRHQLSLLNGEAVLTSEPPGVASLCCDLPWRPSCLVALLATVWASARVSSSWVLLKLGAALLTSHGLRCFDSCPCFCLLVAFPGHF